LGFINKLLRDKHAHQVAYCALLSLLAGVYFHDIGDLLLEVDDEGVFKANEAISEDFSNFFSSAVQFSGRPAKHLVLWLGYTLWGNNPRCFHFLSVAVHTLTSILLASLCRQMKLRTELGWLAGLLFLVNVAHFQAVYWISALDYPLYLLFGILLLRSYLRYLSSGQSIWMVAFYVNLFVATMAHLATVSLLPFCLYFSGSRGDDFRSSLNRLLPAFLLFVPLGLFILSFTSRQVDTWLAIQRGVHPSYLFFNMGRNFLLFLSRLVTLAHWVSFPFYEQRPWELYVGVLVLLGLGVLIYKRVKTLSDGAVWILLSVLPFLPLSLNPEIAVQLPQGPSRHLYMATAGTSLLLAWGLDQVRTRFARRGRWLYGGMLLAVLFSSYSGMQKVGGLSFYTSARGYIVKGDFEEGAAQLERAVEQGGNAVPLADAYLRLCNILVVSGADYQPFLSEALQLFPGDDSLNSMRYAIESLDRDPARRQTAVEKIDQAYRASMVAGNREHARWRTLLASIYHNMGVRFTQQQDVERSIIAYQRAFDFDSTRVNTLKALAFQLFKAGRKEEIENLTIQATRIHPDHPETVFIRMLFMCLAGQVEQAIEIYRTALGKEPSAKVFYDMGEWYKELGQDDLAFQAYQQSIAYGADGALLQAAHIMQASILKDQGNREAALAHLQQARQIEPDNADVHFNLGILYFLERKYESAVEAYRESARLNPQGIKAHIGRAAALSGLRRFGEAEQVFREAIRLNPNEPALYHHLGELKIRQGDKQQALIAFHQATILNSEDIETYLELARIYRETGRTTEALQIYRRILETDFPNVDSNACTRLGMVLYNMGVLGASTDAYEKAISLDVENSVAYINLGWNLYRAGDLSGAIAAYRTVLQQQRSSVAQFNLGLAYLAQGDMVKARKAYARGIAEFGAEEGRKIGAVEDLRDLTAQGVRVKEAREILLAYWNE